jgi:hypothetical protein
MKRRCIILSAATVAFLVSWNSGAQQVYTTGIYSAGTTYWGAGTTMMPFPPFKYDLTEIGWYETTNGDYICGIPQSEKGLVSRRSLEVTCGSEVFYLPLDFGPSTQFANSNDVPIVKCSGNLASVVIQCTTNRGGRTIANTLPEIQANWLSQTRTNEDVIVLEDDHFTQVQNLFEQAYGKPDGSIFSTNFAGGDCRSISYAPAQIGVFLNLTRTWDDATIISIVGNKPKP